MSKYILYARKSQEADDKQVLSIGSQIDVLNNLIERDNLNIVVKLSESKTAKLIGRPIFNEMIARISNGQADSILVWHPDRLSRNPVDAGTIINLLDLGLLKEVRTPTQTFHNTPTDKFVLNLLLSNAKLENDNKSENVKRGMKRRADLGLYPFSGVPTGYINIIDEQTGIPKTIEDPDRFYLVRKMWDLILSGQYNVPEILNKVNNDWGFRTKKKRKTGGKPLSRSGLYNIFTNYFYYGWYLYNGEWKQSNHKPMITKEEFDKVQMILGRKDRPRPQKHISAYSGIFKCGECGFSYTMTEKTKYYPKTNNLRKYYYHHCTKKNRSHKCTQQPLTQYLLEKQVVDLLSKIEIHEEFKNWAIEYLKYAHEKEQQDRFVITKNLQNTYNEAQKKIDRLLNAYINGLITDENKFKNKKDELLKEKEIIKQRLESSDYRANKWIEECENSFSFSYNLKKRFQSGSIEVKKQILTTIGSNFIIKNKKIAIGLNKPYFIFKDAKENEEKYLVSLEPVEKLDIPSEMAHLAKENPLWLPRVDSNRQPRP